ncbi:glycosyltransferase family 4 protein [Defluviitalea phaphyphila]|uniref:glycosyltransferase family 4 protein n=1 Tax=Defluviitalea phaphyphila TaxID=1473580 RepID=UPI00072FFC2C|nr:glycosyltransferase family 4 protein [Defluviitalea phaphyphila]
MNIGIFTDTYYPQVNGVVTSIKTLEKELNDKGHKVYIFTTSNPKAKQSLPRVFRLPSMPFVFLPSHRVGVIYSHKAVKLVKQLNLDIIHTQTEFSLGIFGKIMSKKLNIPIVHTYHTMYEDYVHYISKGKLTKITPKMARSLSKLFCNRCDTIIAPTNKVKELLLEYGVRKDIKVIPTGINIEPFKKEKFNKKEIEQLKNKLGIKETDHVILFIGRVAKEKSIDVIIKSMPKILAKIPNTKLLIVGDGPIKKDLENLCENLNITKSVIFAGEQPWKEIGKFYQIGDVFVSASITETQGLTFAEAMAAKIPVVAKQDKSIEGIINDGIDGRIFTEDEELPSILIELLTKKEIRNKLAENAAIMVEPLSSTHFGNNIEQVYKSLLPEKN